jgi:predicted nuclease of predicted toxin-antitoxin system
MKLYLDQMLQTHVAVVLRQAGHDVLRACEVNQSRADDRQILLRAIKENRVLVTLDEHFGDWVVLPLRKHPGVIRVKVNPTTSANIISLLVPFLTKFSAEEIKNQPVIVSSSRDKWIRTG